MDETGWVERHYFAWLGMSEKPSELSVLRLNYEAAKAEQEKLMKAMLVATEAHVTAQANRESAFLKYREAALKDSEKRYGITL